MCSELCSRRFHVLAINKLPCTAVHKTADPCVQFELPCLWRATKNRSARPLGVCWSDPRPWPGPMLPLFGFYIEERGQGGSNGRCYETHWEIDNKDAKMAAREVAASWPTSKANNAVSTHCFQ